MSNIEYELRVLEVNQQEVEQKLKKLGAEKIAEHHYRRYVFETNPAVEGRWVRLRSNGTHHTLTVKQITADTVDGTAEWETNVDDFDTAYVMLQKMGLHSKGYQENKRTEYELDGCQVCIDSWPKIPAYLEIESTSEEKVRQCAYRLGLVDSDLTGLNTQKIYAHYGIDISQEADLRF